MTDPGPLSIVEALSDQEAITVLHLVLEHEGRLPDVFVVEDLDAQVREAAGQPIDSGDPIVSPDVLLDGEGQVTQGALARETLGYLVTVHPHLGGLVQRASVMARADPLAATSRFEPVSVGAGVLVVLALQTEVQIERGINGKWRFKVHKKALSDSTLGILLAKVISTYTGGTST